MTALRRARYVGDMSMRAARGQIAVVAVGLAIAFVGCGRHRDEGPRDPSRQAEADARQQEKEARREAKRRAREERATRRAQNRRNREPPQAITPSTPPSGTCDASCAHYLQCKGLPGDAEETRECVAECHNMKLTQQALAGYEQTDCATAIQVVEGAATNRSPQKSTECNGCVWDGSSCIWLSSSNWGAGPYSGAYSSCNASCCTRR
jgi:hypothetical protein